MNSCEMLATCARHQHPELFKGEGAYIPPASPIEVIGQAQRIEEPPSEFLGPSDRGIRGHRELLWNTEGELSRG